MQNFLWNTGGGGNTSIFHGGGVGGQSFNDVHACTQCIHFCLDY